MNNSRLFSLLSVALLLSYTGSTICTKDGEQEFTNAAIGSAIWLIAEAANYFKGKDINCINTVTQLTRGNAIHKVILCANVNIIGGPYSFEDNRIKFLMPKEDDFVDNMGTFEAFWETVGSMGTLFGVKKACEVTSINKMIEKNIGDRMPYPVKAATEKLVDAAIIHFGWQLAAKGLIKNLTKDN